MSLSPEFSFGQNNIGEFNRKEYTILENLRKEDDGLNFSRVIGFNTETSREILTQYINKAKQIVVKYEARIQKCNDALKNLKEIPSAEIKTNLEYKSTTEGIILEYELSIKAIKGRIETAQKMVDKFKEKPSEAKVAESEKSQTSSSSLQSNDDFWSESNRNSGEARKVDNYSSERAKANKITADFERREAEQLHMESAATQAIASTFTSFYATRAAGQNLQDASKLEGHFDNIEDLNRAFSQKLSEVSEMGSELRSTSIQSAQNQANSLAAANTTSTSNYTAYGQALGALGGIAAGISADKAEQRARDELRKERDAQEKIIKARQLEALLSIREEIGKMFPEGGMPLSSHKINEPVLYLFAYYSNKSEWGENKTINMAISNVIPIYRYSDGTYPYISNVKRTFESGGISNPTIVGYFTDRNMAEKYLQSLKEVAEQGRFLLSNIEIKVKEKETEKAVSASEDFWGNEVKSNPNNKKKTTPTKNNDNFWNN